ncbi:hypothetical protein C8R43DRAFT_877036, partial [Mycena crocata]
MQYKKRKDAKNPVSLASRNKTRRQIYDDAKKFRYLRKAATNRLKGAAFPPKPPSMRHIHRILTNSAAAFKPERFLEAGCAVCGRLQPLTNL